MLQTISQRGIFLRSLANKEYSYKMKMENFADVFTPPTKTLIYRKHLHSKLNLFSKRPTRKKKKKKNWHQGIGNLFIIYTCTVLTTNEYTPNRKTLLMKWISSKDMETATRVQILEFVCISHSPNFIGKERNPCNLPHPHSYK